MEKKAIYNMASLPNKVDTLLTFYRSQKFFDGNINIENEIFAEIDNPKPAAD
jgi:hypothetical protein